MLLYIVHWYNVHALEQGHLIFIYDKHVQEEHKKNNNKMTTSSSFCLFHSKLGWMLKTFYY